MSDDPRKKINDVRQAIDLQLDGLLGELGKTLGDVFSRLENATGEVRRSHSFDTSNGPVRAEAGIRIRVGDEEYSSGPTKSAPKKKAEPNPAETSVPRDVSATILVEPGLWSLSAELPGMTEDNLTFSIDAGQLHIHAEGQGRAYSGKFDVPDVLTLDAITVHMRNGILDLSAVI